MMRAEDDDEEGDDVQWPKYPLTSSQQQNASSFLFQSSYNTTIFPLHLHTLSRFKTVV